MKAKLYAVVALCGAVGCSTPTPFEGDEFERVRNQPAHPFTVEVELKQDLTGTQAQDAMVPAIVNTARKAEIEAAVVRALQEYNTFAAAYAESSPGTAPDLALEIAVSAPANEELGEVKRNNLIWGSLFLWLLAGFPGWILEDTEMDTKIDMTYRLVRRFPDMASEPEIEYGTRMPIDISEAEKLNFWRRAGVWQYTQQIIIPPFLVGSNMEKADQSMFEGFTARMQQEVGQRIKQELAGVQVKRTMDGISIPYLQVMESGGQVYLLLFSDSELVRGELDRAGATALTWTDLTDPVFADDLRAMNLAASPEQAIRTASTTYKYIYRAPVERNAVSAASGATPARLRVSFRGDERTWSWTPRVAAPAVQTAAAN